MDLTIGDIYIYCTDLYSYVRHALYIHWTQRVFFSREPGAVHLVYTEIWARAQASARECEITRGDGRGQRLSATRVLGTRQEPECSCAERARDTGPCDPRGKGGGERGQEKGEQSRGGFFSLAATSREKEGDRNEGGDRWDGSRKRGGKREINGEGTKRYEMGGKERGPR